VEERKLGLWMCVALVVGNTIGSGIFLLPAALAPFGLNSLLAWLATSFGAVMLACVFSGLGNAFPDEEGSYGYVRQAFGDLAAFVVAWGYWIAIWVGNAAIATGSISYLANLVPALANPTAAALTTVAVVWLLTAVNLLGVRAAGGLQVVTTVLKLLPLLAIAGIGVALFFAGDPRLDLQAASAVPISASGVTAAAALTLWALLGFECASLAAARVRDPEVNVPRATLIGTGLTGLLYLLVCSAIAMLLPQAVASTSPAPFATFVERYWSAGPAALVAVFAIISCVGALNGWILIQGELMRSMAAKRMLPAWFGATDETGTPRRALLISAAVASVLALLNASRTLQGLFEFLLLLSTSATLWFYLACALSALRLDVARPAALLGAVYAVGTLWGAGIAASGLSLVLMVAGLPLYWWARRERAVKPDAERYSAG